MTNADVPAIRFERITKRFPGVIALDAVSLAVATASCHALCGENGAGKSTLARILAGIYQPDAGELYLDGRPVALRGPRAALAAGIGIVHQELAFCENLSLAENLCLGSLPARAGFVSRPRLEERARALLDNVGIRLDLHRRVGDLSIAQRQLAQIAAAVGSGARIIIFDEPTSSLTQAETEHLYHLITQLKTRGVTCLYVTHRLHEMFRVCDYISVLRDGRHVATKTVTDWSNAELVRSMIGRPLAEYFPQHLGRPRGAVLLEVDHLSCPGKFQNVSFSVCAGEIVALAGLVGAGRTELAHALFGVERNLSGSVRVRGRMTRLRNPRHAIALGIALVPEDRKRQGLVLPHSGLHNTTLAVLHRMMRGSWIRRLAERSLALRLFELLRVRARSIDAPVAGLSGGNQQKIVVAKWLAAEPDILVLDEPTRGVDVGAKAEIHLLIDQLAAQGRAVLLISSELPELLSLATRVIVLRNGQVAGELPRETATQEAVLHLMSGWNALQPA